MFLRKPKLKYVAVCFLVIAVLLCVWAAFNFRRTAVDGQPLVTPAADTTIITSPLDENGDPDYMAYLNQQQSEGVTPENNAAVDLVHVLRPSIESWTDFETFCKHIEAPSPPENVEAFYRLDAWIKEERAKLDASDPNDTFNRERIASRINFAMNHPWTNAEFPEVAEFLDRNSQTLVALREASAKSRMYHPLIDPSGDNSMLTACLEFSKDHQRAVGLLQLNATRHLGNGKPGDAFADALCMRMHARLAVQNATSIERLFAYSIERDASRIEWLIARSESVTAEELKLHADAIANIHPMPAVTDCFDNCEKFVLNDSLINFARSEDGQFSGMTGSFVKSTTDWEIPLRMNNEMMARIVAAMNQPTFQDMQQEFDLIISDLELMESKMYTSGGLSRLVTSRKSKGKKFGEMFLAMMTPKFTNGPIAHRTAIASHGMSQIVLALELYKIDHDSYPEKLSELAPKYCKEMPPDPFVDEPFRYKLNADDNSYELYTVGANGIDNEGMRSEQSGFADDWPVKVDLHSWQEVEQELREDIGDGFRF